MDNIEPANPSDSPNQFQFNTSKIPILVVLIGIPGSGKSTFATTEERFKGMVRINLDTLGTREEEMKLLIDCFTEGKSIIVDNTNVNSRERSRYIPAARKLGYRVEGYFLQSRLKDCIERNNQREGKARIPVIGVINRQREMELPRKSEGFDALYFVTMKEGGGFDVTTYKEPRKSNNTNTSQETHTKSFNQNPKPNPKTKGGQTVDFSSLTSESIQSDPESAQ